MSTDPLNAKPLTFHVIITGIREDISIETCRDELAALFKTTPAKIDRIFARLPCTLKKNLRFDQSARYKTAVEKLGGICHIEEDGLHERTQTQAPPHAQENTRQPSATLSATDTPMAPRNSTEIHPRDSVYKRLVAKVPQKYVRRIRNFLLLDIPQRSIELNFKLPSPSARAKVGSASSADLYNSDQDPIEFFRLLHARIKLLNFASLSTGKRLNASRDLIKIFYLPAKKQLVELAKTGGVPEPEDSRQLLILISDIASILVTSCAMVFANFYEGSQFHYARNRQASREMAASILELLLLKQRARALRYQHLDSNDWSIANTVFHVMWVYEGAELAVPTRLQDLDKEAPQAHRTLVDQFILLQVCAWFDLLRLPTALQWVVGSYLLKVEHAVQIKPDAGTLNANEILVYCYGKQAAETRRLDTPAGPALILNLNHLIEAMHQDCQAQGKFNAHDASRVMPRFVHFATEDHFVIRNKFLSRLNFKKENVVASGIQQMNDLRIFVGFSAIFAMLQHRRSAFASEERLEDSLSKRSAVYAVDGREIHQSLWSFSFQNEDTTRFTTTEGKETIAMGIGMLVAYGAGDEIHRPRLAVVSRIERPSGGILELDMRSIAQYCEPVVIRFNAAKTVGLLVYDHRNGGGWSLAVAPRDVLIGVDTIELHRHQKTLPVTVTAILDASHDFYLLRTTLTSSQLGFQGEPQYPAAIRKPAIGRVY